MPGEHSYDKQQLSAWVDNNVAEKVAARAEADHVTKSDVVRDAVETYLGSAADGDARLARIEAKLDDLLAVVRDDDTGMVEKIQAGMAEPVEDCIPASEVEW